MENESIGHSRKGDVFHYRWAARRCLKLIIPKSPLRCIVIEGSKEREGAGESVIDVAEYVDLGDRDDEEITYFQLKHSTKRVYDHFNLSDLRDTIEGFAKRFRELCCEESQVDRPRSVKFSIVTNRSISERFKNGILEIGNGVTVGKQFQKTLEKYTELNGEHLRRFCTSLELADGEGNYNVQRHELHAEMSTLVAGAVDNTEIDSVIALVQDPDNFGRQIVREDILQRFGVTSERELFPAPPEFEELECSIKREQHESLLDQILQNTAPIIIHASGGVGKSVVARQLMDSLPIGSLGIVYDCFGSGTYRSPSKPRHRHRDALVQLANEIAYYDLCKPLIFRSNDSDDAIQRAFLTRMHTAATVLRKVNPDAVLVAFIDAADNAEMAAREFSDSCFAQQLLREDVPEGCRIVTLCRTERINYLMPLSKVRQYELLPFSEAETLVHLQEFFADATTEDGLEFYRLTGGNPRVQANAICQSNTISDVLVNLGPSGTTVNDQISAQLDSAISKIKETGHAVFQEHIEAICLGLANLPPFIPINVLATAAKIEVAEVKSFVADLGRPLWLSDNSVQFRDEPTETWFRQKYSATAQQIESYLTRLKPLASEFSYVAEVLPSLLLQSKNYDELIRLALSDELLPEDSPIDKRNIRVHRLQFAFKAALKLKQYADAAKLAFRAGEEVSGDNRQLDLLTKNVDLIAPLQSEQRVQELAFRHMLCGSWDGSENAYSAALLSSVEDFKGEARCYLRAAENWLRLYFDEPKKNDDDYHYERLHDADIVELAFAHFNLFGSKKLVDFILSWKPPVVIFRVARKFIRRLVDAGNFVAIDEISKHGCHSIYFMIALADELIAVGKFPSADVMRKPLNLLIHKSSRIPRSSQHSSDNSIITAIVSFAEACAATGNSHAKIMRVLKHYVPQRASHMVSSDYQDSDRYLFLRASTLKFVILGNLTPDLETLMPKEMVEDKENYQGKQDKIEFNQLIGEQLPWFIIRSQILIGNREGLDATFQEVHQRSKSEWSGHSRIQDRISHEIMHVHFDMLALYKDSVGSYIENFMKKLLDNDNQFTLKDRLRAVRAAYRLEHLSEMRHRLEQPCYEIVNSASDMGPEERAEWYIDLARAVLPINQTDSAAYFSYAIESVSKFGDEVVERWEAVVTMAKLRAEDGHTSPEIAYRFIRCAELVGDSVAREKYFDRNEAVEVCSKLSPMSAFATFSRWRDRDVGWFGRQLPALAHEAVHSKVISPSTGWSLSAFSWDYGLTDFAALCIEYEQDVATRKYILDTAVRSLRLDNTTETDWQKLEEVAQRFSLENRELKHIITFYAEQPTVSNEVSTNQTSRVDNRDDAEPNDWDKIIGLNDLATSTGLSNAVESFNSMPAPKYPEIFWEEVFKRVHDSNASKFLECLVNVECADLYDVENALSCFPDDWRQKVSIIRAWPQVLLSIARRYASDFTNYYRVKRFIKSIREDDSVLVLIHKGVMNGLSESCNMVDASTFFGFAGIVSSFITPKEAGELLDFSLSRFEEHIDDDYADGPWCSWLIPPAEVTDAFAGFIWAALGSPRSSMRWQAAHCVRMLAEAGCKHEINALIKWMNKDSVDAFGSNKYPFYNLHAQQYLLIAIARVSIDNPEVLKPYSADFEQKALKGKPHVLIQKYASEIALSIESAYPCTYEASVTEQLRQVGISQMPVKNVDEYGNNLESPWHKRGEINNNLEFGFSYDFDNYWFNYLGEVFGISTKQVEELAREVVLNDWNIDTEGRRIHDPRANLWRSGRYEYETTCSHGGYPKTDDYIFYLSYHAMLAVAAKLLQEMPIVHRKNGYEDEWSDWLYRHTLTRSDGRWLADRRDPAPLQRRDWLREEKTKHWRWEIMPDDFLDGLLEERNGTTWVNVCGYWNDKDSVYNERYDISSALVPPEMSQSLLNALTTCLNPWNYKLPDYQEEGMEFETQPFELRGWICKYSNGKCLDEYDPHAGDIDYPPYVIGEKIIKQFGLSSDLEQREWYLPGSNNASLICELWSENQQEDRDESIKYGKRMSSSLDFLIELCSVLKYELIIEINIKRNLHRSYYSRSDDEIEHTHPYSKTYILSADGTLRDARTCYQLR